MNLRFTLFSAAISAALFGATASAENPYNLPADIQSGNILHCYNWHINDIIAELPDIARAGFGAIQLSPMQGNCQKDVAWYYAYMPYDFKLKQTGVGNLVNLRALVKAADACGVKVILDVVANHVADGAANHDPFWEVAGRVRKIGSCNYSNRYSVTHGQLGGYGDINSEDVEVQARIVSFLETLRSEGVSGIRWDAAKHIALPSESCAFWSKATSVDGLWHYGEILDGPGGPSSSKYTLLQEYTRYMGVTDTEYSNRVLNLIKSNYPVTVDAVWASNGISRDHIVYWAESHDMFSNKGGATKYIDQSVIDRAWAIVACRDKETSLYLSRPAETAYERIKSGAKGSTHFKDPEIAEVNRFRNAMVGRPDAFASSSSAMCVTRKDGGAVIVSAAAGNVDITCANAAGHVPAGTYVDRVGGSTFTVTSTTISGHVGPKGIAVIYNDPESGIAAVEAAPLKVYVVAGVLNIESPDSRSVVICRVDGSSVVRQLVPGLNTIDGLARGLYIVDGRKVVI